LIERTVPHRLIIIDNGMQEDCHVDLPPSVAEPPKELMNLCKKMFLEHLKKVEDPHQAADYICAFFDEHVSYRAMLDKLIEEKS